MEIEGFSVIIMGADTWEEPLRWINQFKAGLKEYKAKASRVCPWLVKNQLPLIYNFNCQKIGEGGSYRHTWIEICAGTQDLSVAHVLAHEMGHHRYKHLSQSATEFWTTAIHQDYGEMDLKELFSDWPDSVENLYQLITHVQNTNPILALQLSVLTFNDDSNSKWWAKSREDVRNILADGATKIIVPKHPITGYSGKNSEEAFCEALGICVAYGPRALHPLIRMWLEMIMPDLRVNASVSAMLRVAKSLLGRTTAKK